jgi:hypothetical protein
MGEGCREEEEGGDYAKVVDLQRLCAGCQPCQHLQAEPPIGVQRCGLNLSNSTKSLSQSCTSLFSIPSYLTSWLPNMRPVEFHPSQWHLTGRQVTAASCIQDPMIARSCPMGCFEAAYYKRKAG